jgi:hypothetical protein
MQCAWSCDVFRSLCQNATMELCSYTLEALHWGSGSCVECRTKKEMWVLRTSCNDRATDSCQCVRWYAAYPLSTRNLEETMAERGVIVDHATVHPPCAEDPARASGCVSPAQAAGGVVLAHGRDLCQGRRKVEAPVPRGRQPGQTVDFLLTVHRDVAAARRYFERAIDLHDMPETITIDKSGANTPSSLAPRSLPPACARLSRACPATSCRTQSAAATSSWIRFSRTGSRAGLRGGLAIVELTASAPVQVCAAGPPSS